MKGKKVFKKPKPRPNDPDESRARKKIRKEQDDKWGKRFSIYENWEEEEEEQ